MSTAKTPSRVSKRTRGIDADSDTEMTTPVLTATKAPNTSAPTSARKSARKPKVATEEKEEEKQQILSPVKEMPSAKKPSTKKKDKATASSASSAATDSSSSTQSFSSIMSLLKSTPSPSSSSIDLTRDARTIQQVLLKATTAEELLHPLLWKSYTDRIALIHPNTMRIDLHMLTAIGRSVNEMLLTQNYTPLPSIYTLFHLLLPSSHTPAIQSWSTTFRPSYDFFNAFVAGAVKQLVGGMKKEDEEHTQQQQEPPASFYSFISSLFDTYSLINRAQLVQRKVFDTILQERNLPMWSELYHRIQLRMKKLDQQQAGNDSNTAALRASYVSCQTQISTVLSHLFHTEHLTFYSDVLSNINEEEAAEEELEEKKVREHEEKQKKKREEEEKKRKDKEEAGEDAEGDAKMDEDEEDAAEEPADQEEKDTDPSDASEPASKKTKVEEKSGAKKPTTAAHKPHPGNYTSKLFESLQGWLVHSEKTEANSVDVKKGKDKKRTRDESESAAVSSTSSSPSAPLFTTRSIRACLPLLFHRYILASNAQFSLLYPQPTLDGPSQNKHQHQLSSYEQKKKIMKERSKTVREILFGQKMWSLNEFGVKMVDDASNSNIYTTSLTPHSLPILYDLFHVSSEFFTLIQKYDIYKIHQESSNGAASANSSSQGIKQLLYEHVEKVMQVVKRVVQYQTSNTAEKTASNTKTPKKKGKSEPTVASQASSSVTSHDLLSLSSTLTTNLSSLLQLNPEFLLKYLHDRNGGAAPVATGAKNKKGEGKINIWHFIWKVIQMSESVAATSPSSNNTSMALFSPSLHSIKLARSLSRSLFASFFKLRQYDTLFSSYTQAIRTAHQISSALRIYSFDTILPSAYDLPSMIRSIPPLKVPALWMWFLQECKQQLKKEIEEEEKEDEMMDGDATNKSDEGRHVSTQAIVHFFVYFLDTLMVREEIAVKLSELYTQSMNDFLAPHLRKIQSAARAYSEYKLHESPLATSDLHHVDAVEDQHKLAASSVFLLLHALNQVKMQCDQHTTKTYETMLQPLQPYFSVDCVTADESKSEQFTATRLTDVLSHLASAASEDAELQYTLYLLAIQRLEQLHRYKSRNIIQNVMTMDEDDEEEEDAEMSDGESEKKTAPKKKSSSKVHHHKTQTPTAEAHSLTSYLLEQVDSCAAASTQNDHSAFRWNGASASLSSRAGGTHAMSAVALWKLITSHLEAITFFTTDEQRRKVIEIILEVMTKLKQTEQKDGTSHGDDESTPTTQQKPSSTDSVSYHTLSSLTTSLLVQPSFYELISLRAQMFDVILAKLLVAAGSIRKSVVDTKQMKKSAVEQQDGLRIPASYKLSSAHSKELAEIRATTEYVVTKDDAVAITSSSSPLLVKSLWDTLWLLQLVNSFPAQYLSTQQSAFHSLLIQLAWSLETSVRVAMKKSESEEPMTLAELCKVEDLSSSASVQSSLYSHLFLSSRRLIVNSFSSLLSTPSHLSAASTPSLVQWLYWSSVRSGVVKGRHQKMLEGFTKHALTLTAPVLMAKKEDVKKTAVVSATTQLTPIIDRITSVFSSSLTASSANDLSWCLQLSSALLSSFLSQWSHSSLTQTSLTEVSRAFHTAVKSTSGSIIALINTWSSLAHAKKFVTFVKKHQEMSEQVYQLYAMELIAYGAWKLGEEKASVKESTGVVLDQSILTSVETTFAEVVATLTQSSVEKSDASSSSSSQQQQQHAGSLTFLHGMCLIQPVLLKSSSSLGSSLTIPHLFTSLLNCFSTHLSSRLRQAHQSTQYSRTIMHAFRALQTHANEQECSEIVEICIQKLDPATVVYGTNPGVNPQAIISSVLQFLHSYITYSHSASQIHAFSTTRLSLLFFRLASLASYWNIDISSHTPTSDVSVSLLASSLDLLVVLLTKHQSYAIDDQSMSLIAHILNSTTNVLKDEAQRRRIKEREEEKEHNGVSTTGASLSSPQQQVAIHTPQKYDTLTSSQIDLLHHPLYLVLYTQLKYHSSMLVKVVPAFLTHLKLLLQTHWSRIQSATAASPLPFIASENISRLLEELGRPSNTKLFNKYMVGVLYDYIQLCKYRGTHWGDGAQEQHQKVLQRGVKAIIGICEEHESVEEMWES